MGATAHSVYLWSSENRGIPLRLPVRTGEQCIQYPAHVTNIKSNILWSSAEQHNYPLLISFPSALKMILYHYQPGYGEFERIHTLFFCKELPRTVSN